MHNSVTLFGNIGKDPEVKVWNNDGGMSVTCSLATSKKWNDKQTGEAKEKTEWHRLVVSGNSAKPFAEYVKKGAQLLVTGSIEYRKYDKNGVEMTIAEIKVDRWQLAGRRADADAAEQQQNKTSTRPF